MSDHREAPRSTKIRIPAWLIADQLQTFCVVAEAGSVSRASDLLFLTQPAVSQRIRRLELALGTSLFSREPGRRFRLTPSGEHLLQYLEQMSCALREFERELNGMQRGVASSFRVATSPLVARYLMTDILRELHFPLPITFLHGTHDDLQAMVYEGEADLGIVAEPDPPAGLDVLPLMKDRVCLIAPVGHPITTGGATPEALSGYPIALPQRGTRLRRSVDEWVEGLGVNLRIVLETADYDALKDFASTSFGLAIVSDLVLGGSMAASAVVQVPVFGLPIERDIGVIGVPERIADREAEAFLAVLREVIEHRAASAAVS